MINSHLIKDLRKTLNEAQDEGQESLVWVRRGIKLPADSSDIFLFEAEAKAHAAMAVRRARAFLEHATELGDILLNGGYC